MPDPVIKAPLKPLFLYIVPERKWPFSPISALNKNFNPRNTLCMPAVQIFICLELDEKFRFRSGTTYQNLSNSITNLVHYHKINTLFDFFIDWNIFFSFQRNCKAIRNIRIKISCIFAALNWY